jgi:secernin
MCDTMVALGSATADGSVILAKNSDRPPNEAQYPFYAPRTQHSEDVVRCTHVEIPQVQETFAILLSRPFWIWGGEMGVNEYGVAIGNEAVWTREPLARIGLLGMDLIRLALERAETARRALDVIVELLVTHGQGGSCDLYHPGTSYHNSFLIADPGEAWVLETAGRYWAAKKVERTYSISNGLTIGADFDLASPGLIEHAVEQGWCEGEADFDLARCYSDYRHTQLTVACRQRRDRTSALLREDSSSISPTAAFGYLRDHGAEARESSWAPSSSKVTVCMHATGRPSRGGQSTASLVAHLRPDMPTYWMTGTSAPCTGLFKPFYVAPVPRGIGEPTGHADRETMWWAHERLHRAVLLDYPARLAAYEEERDGLEASFVAEEAALYEQYRDAAPEARAPALVEFSQRCLDEASVATQGWEERVRSTPIVHKTGFLYSRYWGERNRAAGLYETVSRLGERQP